MLQSYCKTNTKCSTSLYAFGKIPRFRIRSQIAKFMGPTWGPSVSCRPQIGPMLALWTLLSEVFLASTWYMSIIAQGCRMFFVRTSINCVTRHGLERWLKHLLSAICMWHNSLSSVNWCTAAIHIIRSSVGCKTYKLVLLNEDVYFNFTSIHIFWWIIIYTDGPWWSMVVCRLNLWRRTTAISIGMEHISLVKVLFMYLNRFVYPYCSKLFR